jgi:hypothetical protein
MARVVEVGHVLPGRDVAAHGLFDDAQAFGVVAADRFFEPDDPEVVECRADAAGLPNRVGPLASTISATSSPASSRSWQTRWRSRVMLEPQSCPILIFIAVHPAAPGDDLFAELAFVERGEAAGAVDRHPGAGLAQQRGQRLVALLGLEVPQGDVDGAEGLHDQPAGSEVAAAAMHRLPGADDVDGITARDDGGQLLGDDGGGCR